MPTIDLNFKNAIVTGREAYVDGYELVSTGKYATGLELKPDGVRVKSWQDDIVLRKADRSSFTWKGEVVIPRSLRSWRHVRFDWLPSPESVGCILDEPSDFASSSISAELGTE